MDEKGIQKTKRLILQFKEHVAMQNYSPRTTSGYAYELRAFLAFLREREESTLADVTAETLYQYQLHLYQQKPKGKPLSLSTQSNRLVSVRAFFRYLTRRGRLLADPASTLAMPKVKRSLPRGIMTTNEIQKILAQPNPDTALGMRDKAILETLYSTGIRNAELRALALYDANVADGELRVTNGKGQKDRVVPLGEIASHYVSNYIKHARPDLAARAGTASPALFLSQKGRKMSDKTLGECVVAKYVRLAKINKPITPHSFRHTCATHMLKGHANIRHIQALLGHKGIDSTQIYTQVEVGDLKKEHRRCHPREQPR